MEWAPKALNLFWKRFLISRIATVVEATVSNIYLRYFL